jgi:hypothetical protein
MAQSTANPADGNTSMLGGFIGQFPDVQSTFDSATFRKHKFTNEGFLQWGYYSKMDGL